MYNVKLVCEGTTDLHVFQAVLDAHLGGAEYLLGMLQPDGARYGGDAGPHGGGWKGVRGWCQAAKKAGGVEAVGALTDDVDLLVIHVDADIACDAEHNAAKPCPPPAPTVQAVEALVLGWLGVSSLPDRVLLWVPCYSTEAWVLRALFPTLSQSASCLAASPTSGCVECISDPASVLLGKTPKLVRRKQGQLKKIASAYQDAQAAITQRWGDLRAHVWSAKRIEPELVKWVPAQ
ncbi:MAG: hypothetical protein KF813_07025 [Trueperaceae bacterium]|nr:hypothetical protein [Trueperaceae bacterium]